MFNDLLSLFANFTIKIRIALFVVFAIIAIYISTSIYQHKTQEFKNDIYTKVNNHVYNTTKLLIEQKQNASLFASLSMATNPLLVDIIFGKRDLDLSLEDFTKYLAKNTDFDNVWFSIIDPEGNVVKRSWTTNTNINIDEEVIKKLQKSKKPISMISVNNFGLVINSIVPVLYDGDFVGVLNVMTHLDSIVDKLSEYGFKSVIILNKEKSDLVDIRESFSKQFIGNYYVANRNANNITKKIIGNRGFEYYSNLSKDKYEVNDKTNSFETVYSIKGGKSNIFGYMVIMQPLDDIDLGELESNQEMHQMLTVFIVLSVGLIIYYRQSHNYIEQIKSDNEQMVVANSQINEKNDALDLNEKKIANIFHIQPNIMLISDGIHIENVNARFLGFFHRYKGGLDEWREKHTCISDFFEPCEDKSIDMTDYFDGDTIKDEPWKDYILANFKRNYKVCMRDGKGRQHHFILKMNEMEYAKLVKRYIVISFIDITNEITKNKEIRELQFNIAERSKTEQIKEMVSYLSTQWKQPLSNIKLLASEIKFKKEMGLLEDVDIENLSQKIINNSKILSESIIDYKQFVENKEKSSEINIVDNIKSSVKLVDAFYKSNKIDIRMNFAQDSMLVNIIPGNLSQSLLNIMTNIKDNFLQQDIENKYINIVVEKAKNNAYISIEHNSGEIKNKELVDITKRYIEVEIGGEVSIEEQKNGTVFTLTIPLNNKITEKN